VLLLTIPADPAELSIKSFVDWLNAAKLVSTNAVIRVLFIPMNL
jgi:hypothetical protein